jgi:hypothetical protein
MADDLVTTNAIKVDLKTGPMETFFQALSNHLQPHYVNIRILIMSPPFTATDRLTLWD